jgi:hypothetical protein
MERRTAARRIAVEHSIAAAVRNDAIGTRCRLAGRRYLKQPIGAAVFGRMLLRDGEIVVCTLTNEHSDRFFGYSQLLGTLGYALYARTNCVALARQNR